MSPKREDAVSARREGREKKINGRFALSLATFSLPPLNGIEGEGSLYAPVLTIKENSPLFGCGLVTRIN